MGPREGAGTLNDHALRVLEYAEAIELVASRAGSAMGREALSRLRPSADLSWIARELARVSEMMAFLDQRSDWAPPAVPDARSALSRLDLEGGVLDTRELHALGALLEASRELASTVSTVGPDLPSVSAFHPRLVTDRDTERAIRRTVQPDGSVLDSASKELGRIRQTLRRARSRIVGRLEQLLKTLPEHLVVPDASVTIRDGRYAIPIRREGRGEVGGIVHDESATGATLFVEPPLAIELMNEIRELERDELREIQRILRSFSEALRPRRHDLRSAQDALVDFDTVHARARAASGWEGEAPEMLPAGSRKLSVVRGRHPLLLGRGEGDVVAFDLVLDQGERGLVVSGPNTGGKSVLLKSVGLIAALAQSGVIPPVTRGTTLPVFTDIFADIGDEQSIAESLSTFSAHLGNLKEILEEAGPESLVLMDEMGTGTDPEEGAALARAILEELMARGSLTVATSHLGALKRLASGEDGIVNASLQFDPDRLEPTYVFAKGRPGRSYGLAIARRLGFPAAVLDRAESYVSSDESRIDELLQKLEREERAAAEELASLQRDQEEASRLRQSLAKRDERLRDQERTAAERARQEARRMLLDARAEVEGAIREVRAAIDAAHVDEASRRARSRVEEAVRRLQAPKAAPVAGGSAREVRTGERVRLTGSGAKGTVVEVRDGRVLVESGGLRIQVPASEASPIDESGAAAAVPPGPAGWSGPDIDPSPEVDLRGLTVEEMEPILTRAIDEGVLADLPEIRIIHGKGTGALRARVADLLASDSRVKAFRSGVTGEGGSGVTVARLT